MRRLHLTSALVGTLLPALLLVGAPDAGAAPETPAQDPAVEPVEDPPGDLGTWSVTSTGPETWTVTWEAPDRLPLGADRPTIVSSEEQAGLPAGSPIGVPTVAEDGRTVEVSVSSAEQPAPASLDVVLSGQSLDEGEPDGPTEPPVAGRWQPPEQELLDVDPGTPGELPTVTSDYVLPGIKLPRMRHDVEMVGHVVKPAPAVADPSHPLVVFLHGRHSYCYNPETGRMGWRWPCAGAQVPIPSHLGYDYIQQVLASQGYVTVSIAANGINAQDGNSPDGGAAARSQLVQAHLDQWVAWAGSRHRVDLDEVVLVSHSRGGEGVSRASLEIPLTAPYTVVGQVLIGPTNFGRQTTPYVPTVTVLPSCDGDVIDLQGQSYTDIARGLAAGDTAMKSSVMSVGANHNFFNTEWTPGRAAAPAWDDWGAKNGACGRGVETRLTAAEQRRVGKAYVAGAVHLFADGDQDYRPMFDGSAARVGSTGDAVVLSHMVGGKRVMRVPGSDATLTTPTGAATTVLCEGTTPWGRTDEPECGRFARAPEATPHWPTSDSLIPTSKAFQMSWDAPGARGGMVLDTALDLTGSDWLDLRTVVDPKIGDVSVQVRLVAQGGGSVVVDPVGGGELPAMPTGDRSTPGKYWAQTLRVDVDDVTGIDTTQVKRIELLGTSDRGRVWVIDVAAASAALPAVPAKRVPIVDLGQVKVDEGGDGTHVAQVPFSVTGDVTDPARFRVYSWTGEESDQEQVDVALPAGTDDGAVEWTYEGDELDSYPRSISELIGHAIRNVMLRDNVGRVIVLDDDPAPDVSFGAVRPRADEGGFAEFEAVISAPTDFEMVVIFEVVEGDGSAPPLRAHDVPVKWLERWTSWREGTDRALHEIHGGQYSWFRPGETTLRFRVPIRDDARSEGRESFTVVASTETGWRSDPVTVHVPAND